MTIKPKTVADLGIDSSRRYARDMEILDKRLVEESRLIPQKTEVTVAKPYVPSEFDRLYAPGKTMLWASFTAPPEYYVISRSLFSYQLIPSLGGYEKQEAAEERLENIEDALKKPHARKEGQLDQDQKEQQEEDKERQVLMALLQIIHKLDKTLALINSRRNQYQRG
ncbi:MAG TPA: DUF5399 family protein [Chlamydiales bacterium]|nr:DUF5399 family protein [Chlamydiales bacterium]